MAHANSGSGALRCPNCGKENFAFVSFCHSCGEPLDSSFDNPDSVINPLSGAAEQEPRKERAFTGAARTLWRWESAVGLLLLALTIGYALFSWQRGTAEADAYHKGIAAEQNKDWDQAVSEFTRASDIQDAAHRKAEAAAKVVERNNMYQRALTAQQQQNWPAAISSLNKVVSIQPDYLDTTTRLRTANLEAINSGLDGVIYLVGYGPSAGLYYRNKQGEAVLLPGSDGHSTVRAIAPDRDIFVYDRPSREIDYFGATLKHNSIVPDPFGLDKTDRIPVLAGVTGGTVATYPLPNLDPYGQGVFSSSGLWWLASQQGGATLDSEVSYLPDYTSAGSKARPVLVSDIRNNKRVVALDAPRSRVIIAQTTGDLNDGNRVTYLYMAGAEGNITGLLDKVDGDILQASVSGDGRRLLYISQNVGSALSLTVWVIPLDASSNGIESHAPQQLEVLSWQGLQMDVHLTASFLPQSASTENNSDEPLPSVIIDRVDNGRETLTVYDQHTLAATTLYRGSPQAMYWRSMSGFSSNGRYVASGRQQSGSVYLEVLGVTRGVGNRPGIELPASPIQIVKTQFSPLDDYVVASVQNQDGVNRGFAQSIYSVPMGSDGTSPAPEAKKIAIANLPYDAEFAPVALPSSGYLMAYITPGAELHAVFLDGSKDTRLADNVSAVWSLRSRTDLSWWR